MRLAEELREKARLEEELHQLVFHVKQLQRTYHERASSLRPSDEGKRDIGIQCDADADLFLSLREREDKATLSNADPAERQMASRIKRNNKEPAKPQPRRV